MEQSCTSGFLSCLLSYYDYRHTSLLRRPSKALLVVPFVFFSLAISDLYAQRIIQGSVTDKTGATLIGANVFVKNTSTGTTTDINGNYTLSIDAEEEILVFSYIGYVTREVAIGPELRIDVILESSSTSLDEVVVVGFGTSTRRKLTTSISSVDQQVYDGAAKTNPLQALQGRMAGVYITQPSGATQSAMNVRVRGQTSINASNQPLVVIDGVITDTWGGLSLSGPGSSKLLGLDPNDIASVDVLKDGAATAIYGSRGANGIILITTKQGQFNTPPRVTVSYQVGASEPSVRPDMMNGPEYARTWNQAALAVGRTDILYENPDSEPTTDWDDLLTRRATFHDIHAAVSGGDQSTSYYVGMGYRNEEDYFITKGFRRYGFQARINQLIGDKWRTGISISPSRVEQDKFRESTFLSEAPTVSGSFFLPNTIAFDSSGDPNLFFKHKTTTRDWSPIVDLTDTKYSQRMSQLRLGTHLEYLPVSNLQLRTEFNVEYSHVNIRNFYGASTRFGKGFDGGIENFSDETTNYNWTNTATWTLRPTGRDELILVAGSQLQRNYFDHQEAVGAIFADPRLQDIAAAAFTDGWGFGEEYRFAGFFARANYSLSNKYFFAASLRTDGSSRFGANNRWGFFPAFSAGWMITEEPFFELANIDYLKISASVGQTGNAEIGNFKSQPQLNFTTSYDGLPGSTIGSLGNHDLTWEETTQYNFSLDFSFWQERFGGTLSWFLKNTDGLLMDVPIASSNGISSLFQNVGAVRNEGWEFEIRSTFRPAANLSLKLGINGVYVKNRITALADTDGDGEDDDIHTSAARHAIQIFRVGEPLGSWYLVPYAGVDAANGNALFLDLEGQSTANFSLDDRVVWGSSTPDFMGGFSIEVDYRHFFLSTVFQTALGHELFRTVGHHLEDWEGEWNRDRRLLDSWTESNTDTRIPESRLFMENGSQTPSTRWLVKADYLRLKNIQLGYKFVNLRKGISSITVYAAGYNLWLLTSAPKDIDPEVSTTNVDRPVGAAPNSAVALPRTISFGLKLEL